MKSRLRRSSGGGIRPLPQIVRGEVTPPQFASLYLANLGYRKPPRDPDRRIHQILARNVRLAPDLARALEQRSRGKDSPDFYKLKNQDLSIGIDLATTFNGELYRALMVWYVQEKLPDPRRVIDVGCDNGILTCFYAACHPDAEVVGLDICPESIACATELAKILDIPNVSFMQCSAGQIGDAFKAESIDQVIATCVYENLVDVPDVHVSGSFYYHHRGQKPPVPAKTADLLRKARSLLVPADGVLLSVERFHCPYGLLSWARALSHSRLGIDWQRSFLLSAGASEDGSNRFPLLMARRADKPSEVEPDVAESFWAYPDLEAIPDETFARSPALAHLLFDSIQGKTLVAGFHVDYREDRGGGRARVELWQTSSLVLLHEYDTACRGRLVLKSRAVLHEMRSILDSKAEALSASGRITYFHSLDERLALDRSGKTRSPM